MKISTVKTDKALIINIEEAEANFSKSDQFKELVFQEIEKGNHQLILSFKQVDYLDSSFLGAVVAVLKHLIPLQGKLVLVELNTDIKNLFELTRLDKVFEIKDDVVEASNIF
ncbi:STAS domain-containing protein [Pedobacter aquae]|uniref:Anti-sigma factor antagonist n=1 Tax=Pedobacter aquae TaxID=2605747 RepID=A0A5C0VJ54_9SPHI|nr:STAS domain-containing protein [Pedobacter aquae]QEK51230.1 STAS domain-containing protein [Pedobacter aquae]